MKKTILFLAIIISVFGFSQNISPTKYEITKDGFTDYIVSEVPGKTKEEIYTKTLEWINKNYQNPEKVIMGKVENDYIRIEGIESNLFCIPADCQDGKYQIEISFKDGKYKFDVISLHQKISDWIVVDFNQNKSFYFDSNGLKKKFDKYQSIPAYFNTLNKSLSDYISGTEIQSNKNNW